MNQDKTGEAPSALVVVPRQPGPLVDLRANASRQRDDLDDLLDSVFGEPTREGPGLFDLGLIGGGTALAVATKLAHLAPGLEVLAAGMIALGLVLPVRDLWQRAMRRRAKRRLDATLQQGFPLNVSNPATERLAAAYCRVLGLTATADDMAADVLEAAHLAMVEVADVLQGREPRSAAEQEYVISRVRALSDLADLLSPSTAAFAGQDENPEVAVRDAAVAAIRRLEETTGAGSLTRIEALCTMLHGGAQ